MIIARKGPSRAIMIQVAASGTQKIKIFLRVKGVFFIKGKLMLKLREFKKSLIKIEN
jgi:hypothetical protein